MIAWLGCIRAYVRQAPNASLLETGDLSGHITHVQIALTVTVVVNLRAHAARQTSLLVLQAGHIPGSCPHDKLILN